MTDICKPEEIILPPIKENTQRPNEILSSNLENTSIVTRSFQSSALSPDGRYTLDSINTLIEKYEKSMVTFPFGNTPLDNLINTYGSDIVYQSLASVNSMLIGIAAPILPQYPTLNTRINSGVPITPVEYTEFVNQFLYTPIDLQRDTTRDYVRVTSQLEQFFTSNFTQSSMGSFCSLAPSIFGAIQGFFDTLDSFRDIINRIQNFNVTDLLNQLRENILRTVDQIIQRLRNAIENFSISSIIGNVQTFVNQNILARVHELQTLALNFFSEENLQNLRNRIEGLINYAINLFRNPSLEEIQYLIYRFCGFMSNVEQGLNTVRQPLDDFSRNYQRSRAVIEARSGINTARAISEGAIRYDQRQREASGRAGIAAETERGNPPPIQTGEAEGVTQWNNGQGDSRITFSGGVIRLGREAWDRVLLDAKVKIIRVQREFGRRLTVISGYRSPELQRSIWISTAVDLGLADSRAAANNLLNDLMRRGAPNPLTGSNAVAYPGNSRHEIGEALDVIWSGFPEGKQRFVNIADAKGFGGIGKTYRGHVHVDIGPRRPHW